jgi:hypothetical protein
MKCRWLLPAAALIAVTLSAAPAQPPIEVKDGHYIVPLKVDATPIPRPALKYRLLPELRDMQSGNQIQAFYKCFFEQNYLFHNKESTDNQEKWLTAPLKDLVGEKALVNFGGSAVRQAHFAARLDSIDWQVTNQAKAEGVNLLLPDLQQMRMLIRVLKVRLRGELARGELDTAVYTLQTMFALSRAFNEHPTLIGALVGIAISTISVSGVEEFVQQPGAPNLFWALADLPTPFIDLRKGREGEKVFLAKEFAGLRKTAPIAEADLKALIRSLDLSAEVNPGKEEAAPAGWYAKQTADTAAVTAARERLASLGHKPAELEKLSPLQLLLMDDFDRYESALDDYIKWTNFPLWQVPPELGTARPIPGPFGELLPGWYKVMFAKARLQQHIGLLTTAEAVRAHAAANGGSLPTSLDAVKFPLPTDPTTGKPFAYEVKEGKAVIRATPPADQVKNPVFNRVYEITIRK